MFPENLPPIITGRHIWAALSPTVGTYMVVKPSIGVPSTFNASKRGGQRRMFSIPHPAFVRDQAVFFEKHWADISALISASPGSASRPTFHRTGPRHVRLTPHSELPRIRLQALSRFKFCLVTDVSRFFPSVYTHSIPWAINGKEKAKNDPKHDSSNVFGNRLDFIVRQSQSRQTVGLSIGQDTSKIVAETIMSAVDSVFLKKSGRISPVFVRHVDDYWIGGSSHEECEKHLQNIRAALKEFELDINESKTKIISTKYIFGDDWPSDFERDIRAAFSDNQYINNGKDPISVLAQLVDRSTVQNDDGMIRHAIRKIDEGKLWDSDWEMLEHFLAQCAVQFPHCFDHVARVIAWRNRTSRPVNRGLWADIALLTLTQNGALGRDSEVIWALWLLKELKEKLPTKASDIIVENNGGLVLAVLAHFNKRRLATDRNLKGKLWGVVDGTPFSGAFWPLTLEMMHLGIADPIWNRDTAHVSMRSLHNAKVSIIDWDAPPRVFDGEKDKPRPPWLDWQPDAAIEDYGDDYGSSTDDDVAEDGDGVEVVPDALSKNTFDLDF
ncbi:RNA-directed DNA polymerase [Aminobacter sp. SR38]|jgi:hypothetical protein|uniref:RNA-directed DNA polymerase n=1 Tax=Aminobacter sp. SR38 TaxID=2774562 RepID=UPI00177E120E|nr:RNA-directed DNA polymerase [Aminobacter sp. SR38]QOF73173.1 RNA-directed DNA polymerase [Aminobacter sp. SR38]